MFKKLFSTSKALALSDDLFNEVMVRNNKRLFISFLSILALANIVTVAIKATGRGSEYLTYQSILIETVLAFSVLIIGFFISGKLKGHWASSYISITGVMRLSPHLSVCDLRGARGLCNVLYLVRPERSVFQQEGCRFSTLPS